jgi:hypothetical protein
MEYEDLVNNSNFHIALTSIVDEGICQEELAMFSMMDRPKAIFGGYRVTLHTSIDGRSRNGRL